MEAALDKAEKRHEAEISRLLAQIDLIRQQEAEQEKIEEEDSNQNIENNVQTP